MKARFYKILCSEFWLFYPVYSTAGEVIGILNDYLFSELPLDIENVHKGATTLHHLKRTLGTACQGLHRSAFLTFIINDELKVKTRSNLHVVSFDCLLNICSRCSALKRVKIHVWPLIKSCVLM